MSLTRTSLRSVRRRPREALMIGLAIAAATAFAAASLLISVNARTAIVGLSTSTSSAVDVAVVLSPEFAASTVAELTEQLRAIPGADDVLVQYVGDVYVEVGATTDLWRISSDPGTGALTVVPTLTEGRSANPGEVIVGTLTAERVGATLGSTLTIGGRDFVVSGIGPVPGFGQDVALLTEEDARALGDAMVPVRLLMVGSPDPAVVEAAVIAAGGGETSVFTGEQMRTAEEANIITGLAGLFAALGVFVGLSLVAAVVIVGSTFRILLGRRAAELALLRSIGASRRQVTRSVRIEAAMIGLVAGVIGTGVGVGAARGIYLAAEQAGLATAAFAWLPLGLVACIALAVVSAVMAASPAAREAGRKPPVTAMGSAQSADARPLHRRRRLLLAAVAATVAVGTAAGGLAMTDQPLGLGLGALSGLAAFAALVLCGPMLVVFAAVILRPLLSGSASARLALSTVRRASRRTSAMTTTLTLGVGLTAALLVGVAGAGADAERGIEATYAAEVLIPDSYVDDPAALIAVLAAHPDLVVTTLDGDILVDPAPGVGEEQLRTAVMESTRGITTTMFWAEDARAGAEQVVTIGQGVGLAMIGTTLLVALIGVGVSLNLSVAERRQELALLRALGVSKSGVRRSIAVEAALAGGVGSVVGVVVGAVYGYVALGVLKFVPGETPFVSLALLCVGVTAAAVAAAVIPLYQAGWIEPAEGMAAR